MYLHCLGYTFLRFAATTISDARKKIAYLKIMNPTHSVFITTNLFHSGFSGFKDLAAWTRYSRSCLVLERVS